MEGDDGFDFDNFEAPRWVDFSKMNENIQDDSWFGGSNRPCNGDDVPTPGNEEENEFECQKEEEFQDNDGQELDDDFFGDEEECCEEQFEEVQEEDDFYHLNKPQKVLDFFVSLIFIFCCFKKAFLTKRNERS